MRSNKKNEIIQNKYSIENIQGKNKGKNEKYYVKRFDKKKTSNRIELYTTTHLQKSFKIALKFI